MSHKVLVTAFQLEANSFVDEVTTLDDFRRQTFAVGADVSRNTLGPTSELAGAWDVLAREGVEIVPSLVAASSPRPRIDDGALAEIVRLACAPADQTFAGAFVALHGSAVAPGDDDPEGTLLRELRRRLGPRATIAISLDHHANLTPLMLQAVDIVTAYRTCPHVDLAERGAQAAEILVRAVRGEVRPVVAMAGRPMITPADLHDSATEPFRSLMAACDEVERAGALAAALLPVQPWLDVPGLGWKAVVTTDADRDGALRAADLIVGKAWEVRHRFLAGKRPDIDAALAEALSGPHPCVLADAGDATNGGALGDSTELLRAVLAREDRPRVLLSIRDAGAAHAAHRAGVGAVVSVNLGQGPPGGYNAATPVRASVERLAQGDLVYTHPAALGTRDSAGAMALLRAGSLQIVVHERSVRVIDPAVYIAAGADLDGADVVQAKSHVSFRAGFSDTTRSAVLADTPGPTAADLTRLPYRRRPRPLFPFEPDVQPNAPSALRSAIRPAS